MSQDRFAQRRRAGWWKRIRRYAYLLLVLVVGAVAVWVVWFSALLTVREVDVSGATTLKPGDIAKVANVTMDEPLARVDTGLIAKRVGSMPRIESVHIGRSWPHTLNIEVAERTALAWVHAAGEIKALDRHGVLFRSYAKKPKGLFEVRIATKDIKDRATTLAEVGRVLDSIKDQDHDLFGAIKRVDAKSMDSIQFELSKGRTVRWGSAQEATAKLKVLDALLEIEASTYDVSAPEQPTTKK